MKRFKAYDFYQDNNTNKTKKKMWKKRMGNALAVDFGPILLQNDDIYEWRDKTRKHTFIYYKYHYPYQRLICIYSRFYLKNEGKKERFIIYSKTHRDLNCIVYLKSIKVCIKSIFRIDIIYFRVE